MTYYSREITSLPQTKREGFCNWIQMAINRIEAGDHQEALLTLVDMLDTVAGRSNPFAGVTDGLSREALDKELVSQRASFRFEKSAAVAKAFKDGMNAARAEILSKLQEAA